MSVRWYQAVFIQFFSFCAITNATSFHAFVDRSTITPGEPIILTLEFLGEAKEEPSLSALEQSFTIVSQQKSSSFSSINGNFNAKTTWILEILPKIEAKTITIPAIALGGAQTLPITVEQTSQIAKSDTDDITLNMWVDKKSVYVNAQLILHIELVTSLPIRNGTITKPELNDAIIEPLVEDAQSESTINGIKVHRIKRSYAIFPTRPGNLTLPSIEFRGVAASHRGHGAWSTFFNANKRVSAFAPEIVVQVKDVPHDYPKDQPFLPLKSLTIDDSFVDDHLKLEINKAITRRFEIKGEGSLASFLPNLSAPTVEHLQIYSEEGHKVNRNIADGVEASSQISHVYMPSTSGTVAVPEQIIYWWNTETEQLATTSIKSVTIDSIGVSAVSTESSAVANGPDQEVATVVKTAEYSKRPSWAGVIAVIGSLLVLCGIVTLAIIVVRRRMVRNLSSLPLSQQLKTRLSDITKSCDHGEGKAAYEQLQALHLWVQKNHQAVIFQDELDALIIELEHALFDQKHQVDIKSTLQAIKKVLNKHRINKRKPIELAPLYPN